MGRSLKKAIYILMPIVAYYIVHDVTRFIMMYLLSYISSHSSRAYAVIRAHDAVFSGLISLVDMLIGAFVLILVMRRDGEELSVWDYVNLNGVSFYRKDRLHGAYFSWIIIVIQAVSMAVGLNILIGLSGIMKISSYEDSAKAQYLLPLWLGIVLYGVVSPAVEELLFRTIVYGRMKRRFSFAVSVAANALFFGLYHGNLVQGLYGVLMGMLMCIACEYVHSVIGAFVMHSVANLTIYLLGWSGLLAGLGSVLWCTVFILAGLLTLIIEICYSVMSDKRLGHIEGVELVGRFYRDPTLF